MGLGGGGGGHTFNTSAMHAGLVCLWAGVWAGGGGGVSVCVWGGGGGTFNTFATHAGHVHGITDTDSWAVCVCGGGGGGRHLIHLPHMLDLLMMSLIQNPRLKMAALTVMTS